MQCQSYFPVCHSHYDLTGDANGGVRPMYNNSNGSFQNRHCNNSALSSPIPQGHFPFGKEFLRQTMLVQELTFRDQVQELHRLYRRQKELMSEIRNKEMFMSHLHLEAQCSNSFSSRFLPNYGQNSQNSLHLPNFFEDRRTVDATVSKGDSNKNNLQFVESKCKKIGGKLLDLELPAEVYIDSEDQESLEDVQFCEAPTSASSSNKLNTNTTDLNKPSTTSLLDKTDKIPENVKILERSHHMVNRENAGSDSACFTRESDTTDTDKAKHVFGDSCQETPSNNMEKRFVVQALPCSANQALLSKGAKGCRIKGFMEEARSLKRISCKSKLKKSMISVSSENSDCLRHGNGLNCFDLNSTVSNTEFTPFSDTSSRKAVTEVSVLHRDSMDSETTRKIKKCRIIDINLPCEPSTEDEPLIEDDLDQIDSESLPLYYSNDDVSPLKSSKKVRVSLKEDLKAPLSPEVEEGLPRVNSKENLPKVTPSDDPSVELDKVAAEVIVSMSLSKLQQFPDTQGLHTLEWFADIIHSMSVDPAYGLDDFEAMTLKLTEMKVDEHWHDNGVPSENLTKPMPQSSQTRKGRTRRSKRKDFQREVLPSLASLSQYEVTEDIQMIEGLMEANGTPWQLCKTRRACRMGRKTRVVEYQSSTADLIESKCDRALVSWGKVPTRARGHRSRGNTSKWFEQSI